MIIEKLTNKVQNILVGLQTGSLIKNVIVKHGDDILDLQRYQLLQGKASNGEDMRPYYTEDLKPQGYFKSVESAKRYAAWKGTLNYPRAATRNADAPNLYINGKFHNELGVKFGAETASVDGRTSYAQNIVSKYGQNKFGLTKANWNEIMRNRGGYDELMDEIKKSLK